MHLSQALQLLSRSVRDLDCTCRVAYRIFVITTIRFTRRNEKQNVFMQNTFCNIYYHLQAQCILFDSTEQFRKIYMYVCIVCINPGCMYTLYDFRKPQVSLQMAKWLQRFHAKINLLVAVSVELMPSSSSFKPTNKRTNERKKKYIENNTHFKPYYRIEKLVLNSTKSYQIYST